MKRYQTKRRAAAARVGPVNEFVLITDKDAFKKDPRGRKRLPYEECERYSPETVEETPTTDTAKKKPDTKSKTTSTACRSGHNQATAKIPISRLPTTTQVHPPVGLTPLMPSWIMPFGMPTMTPAMLMYQQQLLHHYFCENQLENLSDLTDS